MIEEQTEAYFEKLPRKVEGKKCQSLVPDGDLCGKPATVEVSMHGDPGMHEDAWVAVFLCPEHAKMMEHQIVG
jgi:hypothetical protein